MENEKIKAEHAGAAGGLYPGLRIWEEKEIEFVKKKTIRRLTMGNFWTEFIHAFNLDRGFIFTIKGLTLAPAQTILGYLDAERYVITSPIKYFLVIIGLTIFIANQNDFFQTQQDAFQTGIEIGSSEETAKRSPESLARKEAFQKDILYLFNEYFLKYQNIWSAISIIFTTIYTFLFFRKNRFNFLENLAMNTFIYAHVYIVFMLLVILNLKGMAWSNIYILINIIYSIIVFKGIFNRNWSTTIFKGLVVNLLSFITFICFGVGMIFIYQAFKVA